MSERPGSSVVEHTHYPYSTEGQSYTEPLRMIPIRIFVRSLSTRRFPDRENACQAILEYSDPFVLERFENWSAKPHSPQKTCLEGVRAADLYVGLFGRTYSGPTVEEYDEAKRLNKPRLIFVKQGSKNKKQADFLNRLKDWKQGCFVYQYSTQDDLLRQLDRDLRDVSSIFVPRYLQACDLPFTI